MDPDAWHQPQQFRPERFLDESGNVVDKDRIIPFSLGIRSLLLTVLCVVLTDRPTWLPSENEQFYIGYVQ